VEKFGDNFRESLGEDRKETEVEETQDIVAFVRERLGFDPDAKQ
jgi:hypothetical protein